MISMPLMSVCKLLTTTVHEAGYKLEFQPAILKHTPHPVRCLLLIFLLRQDGHCMTSSCCLVVIVYSVTLPPYSTCPYTASPQCWTHIMLLLLVICCLLVWHHVSRTNEWRCEKTGKKPGTRCCSLSGKMPKSNTHTVSEMGREMLADSSNICKEREAKSSKKKHIHCFAAVWPRFVFWSSFSWERVDKSLSVQDS